MTSQIIWKIFALDKTNIRSHNRGKGGERKFG